MSQPSADVLAALSETADKLDRLGQTPVFASIPAVDEALWAEIDQQLGGQIAGRRVLVAGPDPGSREAAFVARGAAEVVVYPSLDGLETEAGGRFEIVHCDGVIHRVAEPITLLRTLRRVTADGGILLIRSIMIDDPERSEYLRFIPDWRAFALPASVSGHPDHTGSFLPGRLALRWMVEAAGFEVEATFGEREAPQGPLPLVIGYVRATAR